MRVAVDPTPRAVLAAVARHVADRLAPGLDRTTAGPLLDGSIEPAPAADPSVARWCTAEPTPDLLGDVLEALQDRAERRRQGAFFTPRPTADAVVDCALAGWTWSPEPTVCDPACGGGAFLLAAARRLEADGHERDQIVHRMLHGADTDPLAVATTLAALALWCGSGGAPDRVVCADTLRVGLAAWVDVGGGFDLVVGNPPFLNQLATRTARSRDAARALADRFGAVARGYADAATLFVVAATAMTEPGGRVALIVPQSFLTARDAAPARSAVLERAGVVGLWLPLEPLFDAAVRVCVPVLEVGAAPATRVRRWRGRSAAAAPAWSAVGDASIDDTTWAPLVADLLGVPAVDIDASATGRLGDRAEATAGFRDQFYGLRPYVSSTPAAEVASGPRLVTSGAIDPVHDLWARRVVRFAGERFERPVVDLARLRAEAPALARWAAPLLVPKLLVATQTRVVEVVVDETGDLWPSVPVVAVVAPREDLWLLAAALTSPAVSAWCLGRHAGAALSDDAIKLSARQVLAVPLPGDPEAWAQGAGHLRAAATAAEAGDGNEWREALWATGAAMVRAHGATPAVLAWWFDRLPPFR